MDKKKNDDLHLLLITARPGIMKKKHKKKKEKENEITVQTIIIYILNKNNKKKTRTNLTQKEPTCIVLTTCEII